MSRGLIGVCIAVLGITWSWTSGAQTADAGKTGPAGPVAAGLGTKDAAAEKSLPPEKTPPAGEKKTAAVSKKPLGSPTSDKQPTDEGASAPVVTKPVPAKAAEMPAQTPRRESLTVLASPAEYLAPTLWGGFGLFQTQGALFAAPWTFGVAMHGEYFRYSEFIIAKADERNTRMAGSVRVDLSLPYNLQVFASFLSSSNVNERDYGGPSAEPQTQMALGDMIFGLKYARSVTPYLNLGAMVQSRVFSGVGEVGPDMGATAVGGRLLATFNGRGFIPLPGVGFLAHLNLGYTYDNSMSLMGDAPNAADWPDTLQPFYQYLVKQFALGVSRSRVEFSLGFEIPVKLGCGVLSPVFEYGLKYFTDSADKDLLSWAQNDRVVISGGVKPDYKMAQNMILGVRYHVNRRFSVDLGVDVALGYPGFAVSPSLPVYNVFAAVNYRGDARDRGREVPGKTITIVKTQVKVVEKPVAAPITGVVAGKVVDDKGRPVSGAIVSYPGSGRSDQATDELGGFISYPLKAGNHLLRVSHPTYGIVDQAVSMIEGTASITITFTLKRKVAPSCNVQVTLVDEKGKAAAADLELSGRASGGAAVALKRAVDASGSVSLSVRPGTYSLIVLKKRYLSRRLPLNLTSCPNAPVKVALERHHPHGTAKLWLAAKRVHASRNIDFVRNSPVMLNASKAMLDEVASLLIEHQEVRKVEVGVHTDNGSRAFSMELSVKRAKVVVEYLVSRGVKAERLVAKGYGRKKPRKPSINERWRRLNRRVEFIILGAK